MSISVLMFLSVIFAKYLNLKENLKPARNSIKCNQLCIINLNLWSRKLMTRKIEGNNADGKNQNDWKLDRKVLLKITGNLYSLMSGLAGNTALMWLTNLIHSGEILNSAPQNQIPTASGQQSEIKVNLPLLSQTKAKSNG